MNSITLDRRSLMGGAAGLMIGLSWHRANAAASAEAALTAWVRITPDDRVIIILSQCEIGQGITTTLPAILADELGADWARVETQNAPVTPPYQNPRIHWMFTGNSESIQTFAPVMRQAGAAARQMLVSAASARWGVSAADCTTAMGKVLHRPSGRSLHFGELAEAAASLPVPAKPTLRPERELAMRGRAVARRDIPAKVAGSAMFGIDVRLPNMAFAALRLGPSPLATVSAMDPAAVLAMPGVIAVVPLQNGAAVVAASTWQAMVAAKALSISFSTPTGPGTDQLAAIHAAALAGTDWRPIVNRGDAPAALARAAHSLTRDYESPFQAHATMEPMNCTADVTAEGAEIWAPTQGPEQTRITAQIVLGLKPEQVRVNWTYSGGGFGRRLLADFVVPALLASKATGRPVQVVYDRAQDFAEDSYRPATLTRLSASIDAAGHPSAVHAKLVSATQLQPVNPGKLPPNLDPRVTEGLEDSIYGIGAFRLDYHRPDLPVRTSVLRTTGFGPNIFALESFIDELASRAGADPLAYRRALLAANPRALHVLNEAARRAGWGGVLAAGHGRGIAVALAFETMIASVVELSVSADRAIRLKRVVTVADPGQLWDPGIATSNLEGGAYWGLASALKSEIRFAGGAATARNFDGYDVMHLWEVPKVEIVLMPSGEPKVGGLGEVGPVCVPPALANAVFAATGERVRALPLSRAGFSVAGRAVA